MPILPIAVAGTRDCMAKHSFAFRRARAKARVLSPIPTTGMTSRGRRRAARSHARAHRCRAARAPARAGRRTRPARARAPDDASPGRAPRSDEELEDAPLAARRPRSPRHSTEVPGDCSCSAPAARWAHRWRAWRSARDPATTRRSPCRAGRSAAAEARARGERRRDDARRPARSARRSRRCPTRRTWSSWPARSSGRRAARPPRGR